MIRRVNVPGGRLSVVDQGRGPVLLLVHGFPLDSSMWRRQIEALAADLRVIAPDLRGFGASDLGGDVVPMSEMADDLAAMLVEMGVHEPVAFCGLSMGGYVAWPFWQRYGRQAGRLILCDTRATADSDAARQAREEMAQAVLAAGSFAAAEAMAPKLLAPQTQSDRPELVDMLWEIMLRNRPEGIAAAQRGMAARPDMTGVLATIDVPTLVLCGEHDALSPPEEMRGLAAAIPGAAFELIPGAGHLPPLENPEAFNRAVRKFILGE